MANKITVTHNGNGLGVVYLADVGKRFGLGGGYEVRGKLGQDQYLKPGQTIELFATDEALLSATKGIIAKYAESGDFAVAYEVDGVVMDGFPKVEVTHTGNGGQIYLADIGKRYGLGGSVYINPAAKISEQGQDVYLNAGDTVELVATELVLESIQSGSLSKFSTSGGTGALEFTVIQPEEV
jgi:hypothetical protein